MEKADPQVRQLAEQWLRAEDITARKDGTINGGNGYDFHFDELVDLLAAFASHTRREALEPYRDALRQCAHALKLLHPRMDETESCIVKEAYDTARLLAEEKK